jgi:membrane protease YdiL (CAAX protease family)
MHIQPTIQPMSVWLSLILFLLPAMFIYVGFHVVMPRLIQRGMKPLYAYSYAMGVPLALMLLAALAAYRLEGNPMTWGSLMERFNYRPMSGMDWLWTGATLVVILLGYGLGNQISNRLIKNGRISLPAHLPAWLDPRNMTGEYYHLLDQAAGGLPGNWKVLIVFSLVFFFNIVGEEFWWRGYILPRQVLTFGAWAWLIHGVLWAFFHVFKWWDLLGLLLVTLPFSFLVYSLDNNTPS